MRSMKTSVLLLVIFAVSASAAEPFSTYRNDRFSFSVDYPSEVFYPKGESGNGDGQVFETKAGDAKMAVFGQNMLIELKGQCDAVHISKENGSNITYKLEKPGTSVASGLKSSGRVFYVKTIKAGERCLVLEMEYPIQGKTAFEPLASKIGNSFRNSP